MLGTTVSRQFNPVVNILLLSHGKVFEILCYCNCYIPREILTFIFLNKDFKREAGLDAALRALENLRLEDCCKSEVGLGYMVSSRPAEGYTESSCQTKFLDQLQAFVSVPGNGTHQTA